ncbi:hypothetical protein LNKW23_04030 [Paralimibaculum aggregatum]|uniref:DUF4150 domain-containing protein n=1 Tax=Paralimibaculum aggregatum TaxID=3036245 RepID=A0ABQ6LFL1_9RHOB|nr:hypothetical protein [Limibaculum sp. NKW23]GMG81191.1 hypothetical protein LNKW23_04030 [Limibaculum sp. NKW23]
MFGKSVMGGSGGGLPDVCVRPSAPTPVPIPYPDAAVAIASGAVMAPSRQFTGWVKGFRSTAADHAKAAKLLTGALARLTAFGFRMGTAIDEVNAVLQRIAEQHAAQKKILKDAEKMCAEVDKGFQKLEKLMKSGDAKAHETAKIVLIAKGVALNAQLGALEAIDRRLTREQAALDKALKAVSALA